MNKPKACARELKICPDGSAVGRVAPNCEFLPCPAQVSTVTPVSTETTDWKTYVNTSYNFSFKYPSNFVYEVSNFDSTEDVSVKENDKLQFQVKGMKSYPPGQKDCLLDTTSNGQKTINNIVWKTFSLPKDYCDMGGCTLPIFGLQTEYNGALYSIYFYGRPSENEFSSQILSTFKFLE